MSNVNDFKFDALQVLDSLPDGITIQDREFNVIYQNRAMIAAFGDRRGTKCYAAYERRNAPCEGCGVEKVFLAGATTLVLRTAFDAQGQTSYWENACFPICNGSGDIVAAAEVCRDVSDRVGLEDEVKQRNVELGQINEQLRERTAELAHASDQLSRVNAELTASNKELEAFNYSVAHDLRAPLRHIHGFAEILAEEAAAVLNGTSKGHLKVIQDSVDKMGVLLQELLNLSRIGRQELLKEPCDFKTLIQEVLTNLQPEIADREIDWRIQPLPVIECDATLMKQVLWNLLSNALKFSCGRRPAVIEVGQTGRNGVPVVFVRDNGRGFNMKHADRLFGIFQRLHSQEEFEGAGVGLAVVRRIVRKHGGRVWAESEPNQGTTFYFTLPASDVENRNEGAE